VRATAEAPSAQQVRPICRARPLCWLFGRRAGGCRTSVLRGEGAFTNLDGPLRSCSTGTERSVQWRVTRHMTCHQRWGISRSVACQRAGRRGTMRVECDARTGQWRRPTSVCTYARCLLSAWTPQRTKGPKFVSADEPSDRRFRFPAVPPPNLDLALSCESRRRLPAK